MIGKTLAHYKITEKIGAGGMGEVYRATDSKLGREVALKILPPDLAGNAERMARFEREARVLASLNHTGIAAIYGFEQQEGLRFLVMELAAGEDLAHRLARGPVAVSDALEVARQVAEALEEAHAQGIVHRDLKPANIKVTSDRRVKVLDFGLAKAMTDDQRDLGVLENSPTVTPDVTRAGIILGTAAYMSPEQARGLICDARTDVWAFGCVLYEMLTGRAPFTGKTTSDLIAAVLEREPNWTALPEQTPAAVRTLLLRCLRKDPNERLHSIADARIEVRDAQQSLEAGAGVRSETAAASAPSAPTGGVRQGWVLMAAVIGALVLGALVRGWLMEEPIVKPARNDAPLAHFVIPTPEETPAVPIAQSSSIAISPDGRFVVWVGSTLPRDHQKAGSGSEATANTALFLRRLDGRETVRIEGTDGATSPFVSPDGEWIGYLHAPSNTLMKVAVAGGAPVGLSHAAYRSASWSDDGRIFSSESFGGIVEIPDSGGESRSISSPDFSANIKTHRFPDVLPGSKALVFTLSPADIQTYDDASVALLMIDSGEIRILAEGGMYPRYSPTGHIIFARAGDLMALPFDAERLEVTGPASRVLEGLITSDGWGSAHYDFSDDGTLVYFAGGPEHYFFEMLEMDLEGGLRPTSLDPRPFGEVDISPDGRSLVFSVLGANANLWIHDLARGTATRLTHSWDNYVPVWHPSGDSLSFGSNRGGVEAMWMMAADGTGSPQRLSDYNTVFDFSWSPDGARIAFAKLTRGESADIWALSRATGDLEQLTATAAQEFYAAFSPDGRHIAYISDESGRAEVYVQPYPPTGRRWRLSENGGDDPLWSPDGRRIYFWQGGALMAVDIEPPFTPSRARALVDPGISDIQSYDIFPDGRRFLVIGRRTGSNDIPALIIPGTGTRRLFPRARSVHVVVNWFAAFGS